MKRYFVISIYRSPDANTMERALVENATREFEDCIVHEERIPTIVERLKWIQRELLKERPRLKTVTVEDDGDSEFVPGHRSISIGSSQISLTLVKAEIM
jgi:hypothetical protein